MIICDTHADTLSALAYDSAARTDITPDRLRRAGVSLQTLALYVGGSPDRDQIARHFDDMLRVLDRLKAEGLKQTDDPGDAREGESLVMLSVEGCDLLADNLDALHQWRALGVRMAAITWNYKNALGTPAKLNDTEGLTPFGRLAVREMARTGIAPDTSHLNERGFYDILELGVVPLASHSCCKSICGHKRNLSDDQLRALFDAGGYVGLNFYPWFLNDQGRCTLDTLADHMLHMLDLGGEGHVGLGSDFDGIEVKVPHLNDPTDLPALFDVFRRRGIDGELLEGIAGKNLLRYYERYKG